MSTYMEVVSVDTSAGGVANDSLVTLDGSGDYFYHFTGDVVFSGKVYISSQGAFFRAQDEEGNLGGSGQRANCVQFDWDEGYM